MEKISDEQLSNLQYFVIPILDVHHWLDKKRVIESLESIVQELKERREADRKPLAIKDQLRMVHDRCPGIWSFVDFGEFNCPTLRGFKYIPKNCQGFCKSCYEHALEGEEQ